MKIGTFTTRKEKTGQCTPKSSAAPVDSSRTNNTVCLSHKDAGSVEGQSLVRTSQPNMKNTVDTFVRPAYMSQAYVSDVCYPRKNTETLSPPDSRLENPRRLTIEPNDYPNTKLFYSDINSSRVDTDMNHDSSSCSECKERAKREAEFLKMLLLWQQKEKEENTLFLIWAGAIVLVGLFLSGLLT